MNLKLYRKSSSVERDAEGNKVLDETTKEFKRNESVAEKTLTNLRRVELDFEHNVYTVDYTDSDRGNVTERGELTELYQDKNFVPEFLFSERKSQNLESPSNPSQTSVASGPTQLTNPTTIATGGSAEANKNLKLGDLTPSGMPERKPEVPGGITDSGKSSARDIPSTEVNKAGGPLSDSTTTEDKTTEDKAAKKEFDTAAKKNIEKK